ncbi:methionyl-tRNA formyltransferase [Alkalihalobacillus sp. LMS39]|uniref:methionyl-tRNA formyltransferase n=1 Tax=Alkalihalobacillus sp. LMS39 TaxID=2924032 RepID=UPI001FB3476A|nr:methionyl-tRNA formyltransferase [Alkalihalobacillus sp. LMS39]UOE92889.1 methionyl-tRNA formyltransferase [Alkalihalobacillus sp. LMS39]
MNVIFMGTPDFSVPVLKQLLDDDYHIIAVVTQPDRPKGRKKTITPPPVKVEALANNIPVYQPEKIKDEKELETILELKPDLIITAAFGQILPKALLDAPKYGCINVHASLLPKYRGGAPIHQAIIDGEKETGITIMYMAEKLDAGDIISQTVVPILENDHVGSLHNKLSAAGAKLLSTTLPDLLAGDIKPQQQDDDEATFAKNISREQEKINWAMNGEAIYNQIRGLHPWPVAFTTIEDKNVKVWWGNKVKVDNGQCPGTILRIENDGFIVATGNEVGIKITDLQPAGKKRMMAQQYLQGTGSFLKEGMIIGEDDE